MLVAFQQTLNTGFLVGPSEMRLGVLRVMVSAFRRSYSSAVVTYPASTGV
jgi:hypothetical protein